MNALTPEKASAEGVGGDSDATLAEKLVGVAASAGGVRALERIIPNLPATLNAAVVIVLHRRPLARAGKVDPLVRLLGWWTLLKVRLVTEGMLVERGHIYVAPPDLHVTVTPDRHFHLSDGRLISHVASSANPLFDSAASVYGSRFIAIVLTGNDADGSKSLPTVSANGGVVLAQEPTTAAVGAMPRAAIRTGVVTRILRLDEIAPEVTRLVSSEPH